MLSRINQKEEKAVAIENFSKYLKNYFYVTSEEAVELVDIYNNVLMYLISEDPEFKRDLELALLSNGELLTEHYIVIGDKGAQPTIANWLKDFIAVNGTDYFDNVVLSRYISGSPNVRKLSAEEKEFVKKLLILYRNLKYFPQSMAQIKSFDEWEIIPIVRAEGDVLRGTERVLPTPKSIEEKKADELSNLKNSSSSDLEKRVLDEELGKNKEVQRLMMMAKKYPEGSIERKAVEAELDRIRI